MSWLGKKTGISDSMLSDYGKGKIPGSDKAVRIAKELGVSLEWLLTGKGPNAIGMPSEADAAEQLGLQLIPETDMDFAYALGGGSVVSDYIESRTVPFRRDWLSRLTRGGPADVFLTRGQGDSMMPTILDDDDVLVNRADRTIRQQDRIWAVAYGDLGMIKRVRRLPSGVFQLNSDNPAVTPIEALEDEIFVVGRVIWTGRRL